MLSDWRYLQAVLRAEGGRRLLPSRPDLREYPRYPRGGPRYAFLPLSTAGRSMKVSQERY